MQGEQKEERKRSMKKKRVEHEKNAFKRRKSGLKQQRKEGKHCGNMRGYTEHTALHPHTHNSLISPAKPVNRHPAHEGYPSSIASHHGNQLCYKTHFFLSFFFVLFFFFFPFFNQRGQVGSFRGCPHRQPSR